MAEFADGRLGVDDLLRPDNCAVALMDHQLRASFPIRSIDKHLLVNNVVGLAKSAKVHEVPTVLTTLLAKLFNDPIFPEIRAVFPEKLPIDRTGTNAWEDEAFLEAVEATGRRKLVAAGLWTEVCLAQTTLSALGDGYEVYFVADASGGVSEEAHEMAKQRMIVAGAVPMTWAAVLSEWTRDYTRPGSAEAAGVMREHGVIDDGSQAAALAASTGAPAPAGGLRKKL